MIWVVLGALVCGVAGYVAAHLYRARKAYLIEWDDALCEDARWVRLRQVEREQEDILAREADRHERIRLVVDTHAERFGWDERRKAHERQQLQRKGAC